MNKLIRIQTPAGEIAGLKLWDLCRDHKEIFERNDPSYYAARNKSVVSPAWVRAYYYIRSKGFFDQINWGRSSIRLLTPLDSVEPWQLEFGSFLTNQSSDQLEKITFAGEITFADVIKWWEDEIKKAEEKVESLKDGFLRLKDLIQECENPEKETPLLPEKTKLAEKNVSVSFQRNRLISWFREALNDRDNDGEKTLSDIQLLTYLENTPEEFPLEVSVRSYLEFSDICENQHLRECLNGARVFWSLMRTHFMDLKTENENIN